ncbi:hypothetical protein [Paracoccus onubensis]|uniref:Uncharacterized protein n=1 Tax=Paracoccus onubensis TaxID=1675788 RepID=A0A418SLZ7_9RHOB|nr:hypothetical protein [Paracoccus onubensis]RJE81996.1 hypothetical protein D3P04_21805 [Paracoccus onubensis]
MKILKIEGGCGYFWVAASDEWRKIDEIDKHELLSLLNLFLDGDVQMDSPEENSLPNEVHKIIYSHIFQKLSSLSESKSSFKDDSERLYFDEINKYSSA